MQFLRNIGWGALHFVLLFLLSYGFLYSAYKYYTPELGGNDYWKYIHMYWAPWDMKRAPAPFIYRQFSATITHLIFRLDIFYDTAISFATKGVQKKLFFSAIFSNYIGFLATAFVAGKTFSWLTKSKNLILELIVGMLCFCTFFTMPIILTGLSDGWSWFLVGLGFLCFIKKQFIPLSLVFLVSIFQREILPAMFVVLAAVGWLFTNEKKEKLYFVKVILGGVAASLLYIYVRQVLLPATGNANQLEIGFVIESFSFNFFTAKMLREGFLAQNILILCFLAVGLVFWKVKLQREIIKTYVLQLSALVVFLAFCAAAFRANPGRIIAMATPIALPILGYAVWIWHKANFTSKTTTHG